MTTHEFYYLVLVCAAFGGLGLFLAVETIVYRRSQARAAKQRRPNNS
jgi:hypothetical protein